MFNNFSWYLLGFSPCVCVLFFFFYFLLMLIWSEGVADGEFAWGMGPLQEK